MHEEALHGYVARGATSFPQAIALASTWDPELVSRVFSVAAREMRARGATLALAPVVDVARDPRWGRIEETYGEDPYLVEPDGPCGDPRLPGPDAAARRRQGPRDAQAFHRPRPARERHQRRSRAHRRARASRPIFFPPFERAVKTYPVRSVMASYNEIDGIPSHANRWLLNGVLRERMGYQGAVVSDYYAIRELMTRHKMFGNVKDAAERAIKSGVDVETPDPEGYAICPSWCAQGAFRRRWSTMRFGACCG